MYNFSFHDKMTSITNSEFISLLMKHKYIIDRMSTQFVDDHIYIQETFRNNSNFTILQAEYC